MKGTYYKTPDRLQGVDREARPCQDHVRDLKKYLIHEGFSYEFKLD